MSARQENIFWSIIIPCYNEAARINNLTKVLQYLHDLGKTWELIVVDDGSTDNTLDMLKSLKDEGAFKIISYKKNRGKGYAVKTGMLAAVGKFRLFMDIDLSTPLVEMEKFSKFVNQYDLVIGTRKMKGAKVLVHQPFIRENLGKFFTLLSQLILNVWVSDFTCGFKCFSEKAARQIFQKTKIFRWGFDSETLFLAKKYGFEIKEVPVTWRDDRQTRVRFPKDLINSLSELLTIRYFDLVKKAY
jgi:dolichyl-phosphate beta-glucosyltransferase